VAGRDKAHDRNRTIGLASQLFRALGSIHANFLEGYSRGSGRDRARFYEYALGSARESRGWYFDARHILGEEVSSHRMQLLTEIIRLALTMIPDQRGTAIHEESPTYGEENTELNQELLTNAPFP
jgi:four helix bundle protein